MKTYALTGACHTITFVLLATVILFAAGCSKNRDRNVTVIRDCTGTYLRMNDKDYHVCNNDILQAYEHNTEITATFRCISHCTGGASDEIVCMMMHENEGWVRVDAIE